MSMYVRFMAMIGTSTAVMFGLMYLNTYSIDHVFWSETRFWMAFVMGAAMMVVMLAFMWGMYKDRTKNFIILGMAAFVFALARSEEHTSELQSLMRTSYAVFCLQKTKHNSEETAPTPGKHRQYNIRIPNRKYKSMKSRQ